MRYTEYTEDDFESWLDMAMSLWPEETKEEMRKDLLNIIQSESQHSFFAKTDQAENVGFINVSIRVDYVEGSDSSPTGYMEGIYVKPEFRMLGVGRTLIKVAQKWLSERKCKQMGSDTALWNKDSQKFHEKIGFEKEDILVHFLKDLGD